MTRIPTRTTDEAALHALQEWFDLTDNDHDGTLTTDEVQRRAPVTPREPHGQGPMRADDPIP